jgi:nitrite reductase/ring-hydroxylating ferredoxin subunit
VAGRLVLFTRDPLVLARIEPLVQRLDLELVIDAADSAPADGAAAEPPPVAAIAQLELAGAVDRIADWRRRWPDTILAASIGVPDQELWHGALAAGADLVANRGALVPRLTQALRDRTAGSGSGGRGDRLPVRLIERDGDGLVGRLPDAPDGSIAVFRIGGRLHAIRDECPHAGASLADGTLDGTIITCPRHGSQFDVTSGARERGPSDFPIRTYRVVSDEGVTWVEVPS